MEKVKKTVNYMKQVTEETDVYITKDGKQFYLRQDAINHENFLLSKEEFDKKFNRSKIYIDDNYDVIVIKELNDETKYQIGQMFKKLDINTLSLGINLIHTDDSGDYTYQYCFNINNMIKEHKDVLEQLENIKREKGL